MSRFFDLLLVILIFLLVFLLREKDPKPSLLQSLVWTDLQSIQREDFKIQIQDQSRAFLQRLNFAEREIDFEAVQVYADHLHFLPPCYALEVGASQDLGWSTSVISLQFPKKKLELRLGSSTVEGKDFYLGVNQDLCVIPVQYKQNLDWNLERFLLKNPLKRTWKNLSVFWPNRVMPVEFTQSGNVISPVRGYDLHSVISEISGLALEIETSPDFNQCEAFMKIDEALIEHCQQGFLDRKAGLGYRHDQKSRELIQNWELVFKGKALLDYMDLDCETVHTIELSTGIVWKESLGSFAVLKNRLCGLQGTMSNFSGGEPFFMRLYGRGGKTSLGGTISKGNFCLNVTTNSCLNLDFAFLQP